MDISFFSRKYLQHSPALQATFWVFSPTQSLPSFDGGGLSQDLTRILMPTPHDLVQALQPDHSPQFPSTAKIRHENTCKFFLCVKNACF